jgi:hypothetical protein
MRRDDPTIQEIIRQLQQVATLSTEYPLDIVKNGDVYHLRYVARRPAWVRITGHASTSYSSGYEPLNHYAGIEQVSRIGMSASEDLNSGLRFDEHFPLFAMDGNTAVPENALVYATPALGGTHYEFVWATGQMALTCPSGGSGSGQCDSVCGLPIDNLFQCVDGFTEPTEGCLVVVNANGDPIGRVEIR